LTANINPSDYYFDGVELDEIREVIE